jgi:hypothetical protein
VGKGVAGVAGAGAAGIGATTAGPSAAGGVGAVCENAAPLARTTASIVATRGNAANMASM